MDSTDKILAMRYARAYMGLPSIGIAGMNVLISSLEKIYGEIAPYSKIFRQPCVSADAKSELLEKMTQERGEAYNFMLLIISKGHFSLAEEIISRCHSIKDKAAGIVKAEIRTPYPLPENMILRIKKLVSEKAEKVQITQTIVPGLIGGFELKCGDILFDASIKGQLKRLEKELEA